MKKEIDAWVWNPANALFKQKNWEIKEANIPNYHQPISEIKSLFEEVDSPF